MNSSVPKSPGSGSFFQDRLTQRGALVARADAPLPVVVLRDVAARPPDERGRKGLHFLEDVARTPSTASPGMSDTWSTHTLPDAAEEDREARKRIIFAGLRVNPYCFQSPATSAMCASA